MHNLLLLKKLLMLCLAATLSELPCYHFSCFCTGCSSFFHCFSCFRSDSWCCCLAIAGLVVAIAAAVYCGCWCFCLAIVALAMRLLLLLLLLWIKLLLLLCYYCSCCGRCSSCLSAAQLRLWKPLSWVLSRLTLVAVAAVVIYLQSDTAIITLASSVAKCSTVAFSFSVGLTSKCSCCFFSCCCS